MRRQHRRAALGRQPEACAERPPRTPPAGKTSPAAVSESCAKRETWQLAVKDLRELCGHRQGVSDTWPSIPVAARQSCTPTRDPGPVPGGVTLALAAAIRPEIACSRTDPDGAQMRRPGRVTGAFDAGQPATGASAVRPRVSAVAPRPNRATVPSRRTGFDAPPGTRRRHLT